jgi:hypothetical protein
MVKNPPDLDACPGGLAVLKLEISGRSEAEELLCAGQCRVRKDNVAR